MSANLVHRAICAIFCLFFFRVLVSAQIQVEDDEVSAHRLGRRELIHGKLRDQPISQQIALQVIVNTSGYVDSAKAVEGPEEFRDEAERIETGRRFQPFEKDGAAVRAAFTDYVFVVPPEEWASPRVPFPAIQDWNTLRIKLTRTGCYGTCPDYSVELRGDGEVRFEGEGNVLLAGHHHGRISKEALGDLVAAFRAADYFSVKDEYVSMTTDLPTYTTSIEFDGRRKTVKDYDGYRAGIPEAAARLENKIDEAAATDKWTAGTAETGPSLLAEGWDFKSHSIENRALFTNVIQRRSNQLIQFFIQHGAPALDPPEKGFSPLAAAASTGNSALVTQLIGKRRHLPAPLLACVLLGAAASGDLTTFRLVLDKGARVNGPLCEDEPPLIAAAGSGKPEVVNEILKYHPDVNAKEPEGGTVLSLFLERGLHQDKMPEIVTALVAAGADVNVRGDDNETPIFKVCDFPELVSLLVKAGADVNAQDDSGETALRSCGDHDYLNALIAAGADLSLRDRQGRTAAEAARQLGDFETARFLEGASKAQ
jgi:ankyrin repeat protein